MPLTQIQTDVPRLIAANRSPASHVAGGIALNFAPDSPRISKDIDIFHDGIDPLAAASEMDCETLTTAGFEMERLLWEVGFRRVRVRRAAEEVVLEWGYIDAWRFFPVEASEVLGWRLHPFDALTNKAFALAGRVETRDLIDLVSHAAEFPLERIIWGAVGKDTSWNPHSLLRRMCRNALVRPDQLPLLATRFTPTELKERWLDDPTASPLKPVSGHIWPRIVQP